MSDQPPLETTGDGVLLRLWAVDGNEAAVRVLTRRHAGLVTGTARRALHGNQSLADEAAQAVFTAMVAKASSLQNHPALNLWLHRAAMLESLRLRRREARSQRRMAGLAAELNVMNASSVSPSWSHALTELDDALEQLPASDRQLLILRFYDGRSFRDIGARFHKTDDTVQKQASRALEKLAALLRRRGVILTTGALAAGLGGGGLTPAASAAATIDFAHTAILQAPHLGSAAKFWQTLQFMTYGKSTTLSATAAVLILFSVSTGIGFYSGVASETAIQRNIGPFSLTKQNGPPDSPERTHGNPAREGGVKLTSQNVRSGKPPLLDILQAASTIRMSLTGEWSMYAEDMYPTLGHYELEDTEKSIALLDEFRGDADKFESVSGLIFSALADSDWQAAKARMMNPDVRREDGKLSGQAVRAVAEAWGRENPEAAFRWANGLIQNGHTPFDPERGVGEKLLADWLSRDAQGAVAEMERRLDDQTPLVGKAVGMSIGEHPQWWLDRLSTNGDPALRNQTLRLARSSLVLLPRKEREASVAAWVQDRGLAAELLQTNP